MGAYNVRGSRGAEVLKLQKFLNAREKAGLPETGYFGDLTFGAVRGFQAKYGINPRSGNQMIKTTTKINELYCAQ
jgi:peptidoglycan hydrolase-like protein with peptidoglycan-binding domain